MYTKVSIKEECLAKEVAETGIEIHEELLVP